MNASNHLDRRRFLARAGLLAGILGSGSWSSWAAETNTVTLPFANGERPLVQYPQKRPLLCLTSRPPQLETPFAVFNESLLTPNDAFFVRYHLTLSPPSRALLTPDKFTVEISGKVNTPLRLSMAELKTQFESVEIVAVNQCSGNSRGFFEPRVPGGQLANGAMGNARWKGVRLKEVLQKAGVAEGARQVTFNGLDAPLLPKTPDFIKALEIDHALDGQVLLAYEMNGEEIPWLNGYPLRLVVPGYYGTYWIKHVHQISVVSDPYAGYWMNPAYRIPANACGCVEPGTTPAKTIPIHRFNVRSFITNLSEGDQVRAGRPLELKGIAFDGGYGITEVLLSLDQGRSWRGAELGRDAGNYSFRPWSLSLPAVSAGPLTLRVKATNRIGQSQPLEPLWNPAGYMRNVIETLHLTAA